MTETHEIDLDQVLGDAGTADLRAQMSGILDRYVAVMASTGKLENPAAATIAATSAIVMNVVQESQARLVSLPERQSDDAFQYSLMLAYNVIFTATRGLGGLPGPLRVMAVIRLLPAIENGINCDRPWGFMAEGDAA